MLYHINTLEVKKPDWKIASLTGLDGQSYPEVSINKTDKKGDIAFPEFDTFAVGGSIQGDIWQSSKGTIYIFAPKVRPGAKSGVSGATIAKAQERKAENIKEAQENKQSGIRVAAAMRDATLITLASLKDQPFPTMDDFSREFTSWLEWYNRKWDQAEKMVDTPFQ